MGHSRSKKVPWSFASLTARVCGRRGHTFDTLEDKYQFIKNSNSGLSKERLCRILEISRSAYYAWLTRKPSKRSLKAWSQRKIGAATRPCNRDKAILRELVRLHSKYPTLGLDPLHQLVKPLFGASRKRICVNLCGYTLSIQPWVLTLCISLLSLCSEHHVSVFA